MVAISSPLRGLEIPIFRVKSHEKSPKLFIIKLDKHLVHDFKKKKRS